MELLNYHVIFLILTVAVFVGLVVAIIIYYGPVKSVKFVVSALDTGLYLYLLALFIIGYSAAYWVVRALFRDKEHYFEDNPEKKIKARMSYKKPLYPASIIIFIIIFILVSGIFHLPGEVQALLQAVVVIPLFIALNGIMFLIEEYIPSRYNYNIYKASIGLAAKSQHDIQNQHFLRGIKYYDKYIRVKFGLAINSVEIIFSRYVLLDIIAQNGLLISLVKKEEDTLADFKEFDKRLHFNGDVLIKKSSAQLLKDISSIIIPIVAIALTLMQLIFHLY